MHPRPVKRLKWTKSVGPFTLGFASSPEPYSVAVYSVADNTGIIAQQLTSAWLGTGEDCVVLGSTSWKNEVTPEEIAAHKLLCQKHFEKRILSCLTAEARRKLWA